MKIKEPLIKVVTGSADAGPLAGEFIFYKPNESRAAPSSPASSANHPGGSRVAATVPGSMGARDELVAHELADPGAPAVAGEDDICGLCGQPGADKMAHPIHWPGERVPDGPLVHADCEDEECGRAHCELSDKQRAEFLRRI